VGVDLAFNALSKQDYGAEVGEVGFDNTYDKVSAHRCIEMACETQRIVKDFKLVQPPPPPPMTLESARTSGLRRVGEVAPHLASERIGRAEIYACRS
jgi:hypothetical protein